MNAQNLRTIVIASVFLVIAAFIFLAVESRGRLLESRVGFIAIIIIVALLVFGMVLPKPKDNDGEETKPTRRR